VSDKYLVIKVMEVEKYIQHSLAQS